MCPVFPPGALWLPSPLAVPTTAPAEAHAKALYVAGFGNDMGETYLPAILSLLSTASREQYPILPHKRHDALQTVRAMSLHAPPSALPSASIRCLF